jgi:type I restriction enzyme M protein
MLGAILGDIVGSRFEWANIGTKQFDLFHHRCKFTDDTVMTCALAKAILVWDQEGRPSYERLSELARTSMREMGVKYPHSGYGGHFRQWLNDLEMGPYNSCGNGSAMRVSAVGWAANSLEECIAMSKAVTEVTHNHPDGIMGAEATAVQIFMARNGASLAELEAYEKEHYYSIEYDMNWLWDYYEWSSLCNNTCQPAYICLYESESFEDCMRNCMSIGGDSDTIGAIAGGIAEAFYGIPDAIKDKGLSYLDEGLREVAVNFTAKFM